IDKVAEVIIQENESLENALRRFKRKVQQEDIIKEIKKHSFYMKPGEKRRAKEALSRKRMRKKQRRESEQVPRAVLPNGPPFRYLSQPGAQNRPRIRPPLGRVFGCFSQLRTRRPKGSAPGVPGYWSPQASWLSGRKSSQTLDPRDQGESASWNTTTRC